MSDFLRFITCGSVDDGKSTLIGRLLHDASALLDDDLAALKKDPDLASLLDGLSAEREQGITIDVAYRSFATPKRRYMIVDTPGHEQYTRNMATGASNADLAVLLVDARLGLLVQTHRHACIAALMGVQHVILAINKMDLVDWSEATFEAIKSSFADFAERLGLTSVVAIPMSGLLGDNIVRRSANMPWYQGPPLLDYLDIAVIERRDPSTTPLRMPVQWVNRPNAAFRGFAGMIAAGTVCVGDGVRVLPSGRITSVAKIVTMGGDRAQAECGQTVTLVLDDHVDCSRGDVIVAAQSPPECADQFEATLVWTSDVPLLPGRRYLMKIGTRTVYARVSAIKHRLSVTSLEKLAAKTLGANEIGVCTLSVEDQIPYEPYRVNRDLGGFILIDPVSNDTLCAGMISFALRRARNVHWQAVDVTREARAQLKGQSPRVVWFTGLSSAGKSTIANLVEKRLFEMGRHTVLLDGDNLRHGLNRDLGFTDADRVENLRRVAEVARLMADAGLIVLVAFISPFRSEREMARSLLPDGEFIEVFVDAPLSVLEHRDAKGLYAKARAGQIQNFTGIDSPYEPPLNPEIHIDTTKIDAIAAAVLVTRAIMGDVADTLGE